MDTFQWRSQHFPIESCRYLSLGSYNEFLQLIEAGVKTDSIHIMRFADYGYNLPEDGLYVSREFYQKYPQAVQKLARASIRGWEWANEHREQTLDIIMEQVHQHNIGTNRYHQRKMLDEILRLQTNRKSGQRPYRLSQKYLIWQLVFCCQIKSKTPATFVMKIS